MLNKFYTNKEIAEIVSGHCTTDEVVTINGIAHPDKATSDDVCFIYDFGYENYFPKVKAGIIVIDWKIYVLTFKRNNWLDGVPFILVDDCVLAQKAFTSHVKRQLVIHKKGIEEQAYICESSLDNCRDENLYIGAFAYIGENVKIGKNVKIYPQTYVGDNVSIGDNTIIYPGAKIYHDCKIGSNCIIQSGAVIGSDCFVFIPDSSLVNQKIEPLSSVIIEDDVEVGPNVCISSGEYRDTIIERNSKLDGLVMIGHDAKIGESSFMCGQSGVAGGTEIGKHCVFGGQAGAAGNIKITDGCVFGAQCGVHGNVNKSGTYLGSPAIPIETFRRAAVRFKQSGEK